MKLALAAAALALAHPVQALSPFLKKKYMVRARNEFAERKAAETAILPTLSECDPTSPESTLSCPSETYCVPVDDGSSDLGGLCSRLITGILNQVDNPSTIQECNPTSPDPDVGILSCGDGNMCIMMSSSSLGGVCVPLTAFDGAQVEVDGTSVETDEPTKKRGSFYCDPSSPYFGFLDCDCTGFNTNTQEGSFSCSYTYCFEELSDCCAETCADVTLTYSAGSESFTYETCYAFNSPYPQTFCYGQTIGGEGATCFGSFNDMNCDSCKITNSSCTTFSCGAADLSGEMCMQDFYPPILTSCYAECSTCAVCPSNPNKAVANEDSLVGFSNFTCGYVNYLGEIGMWGGPTHTECLNIRQMAKQTCCEGTVTSPPVLETNAPTAHETSIPETSAPTYPVSVETESPTEGRDVPNPDSEATTCTIRIQTNKCSDLLKANSDVIPCSCENKCITFIDDKFDKCDGGNSISGAGIIVAGCTFEMAFGDGTVPCHNDVKQSVSAVGSASSRFFGSLAVISLMVAWSML